MPPVYLCYQVRPNENLPEGMHPLTLTVLSPVWQGPVITLVYPDGFRQALVGCTAGGSACNLQIFWTQSAEGGPTVCLAIGGDGGVRLLEEEEFDWHTLPPGKGRPFLALAESLIPALVTEVIGPAPPRTPLLLI